MMATETKTRTVVCSAMHPTRMLYCCIKITYKTTVDFLKQAFAINYMSYYVLQKPLNSTNTSHKSKLYTEKQGRDPGFPEG